MIEEYLLKNEEKAIMTLRSFYRQYGYLPFKMGKFEEYELYIRNKDFLVSDKIITFNDTNGKLMALKPDVTLSIIKNGEDTTGYKQKVFYNESVYRVSDSTNQYKEFMQTGLECIGDIDLYDIYEVVSLAAKSLSLISEEYVLEISHLGIISSLLDEISGNDNLRLAIANNISKKNPHDLRRVCEEYKVQEDYIVKLCSVIKVSGNRREVLSQLDQLFKDTSTYEEVKELIELSKLLDFIDTEDRITFDFSIVNDMKYYNGIVFKGFLYGIAEGVLTGGQYDNLMEKMGRSSKGIGFALYLDRLEELKREKEEYDVDLLLVYDESMEKVTLTKIVDESIQMGKRVTAQKVVPNRLRYKEILDLRKEKEE